MKITLPSWLNDVPEEQRLAVRTRFLVRAAALYATPDGQVKSLARRLNLHKNTLSAILSKGQPVSADTAVAIEKVVGRDLLPRELLRPDLFSTEA